MGVAEFFLGLVGADAPVEFRAYDGTRAGPEGAPAVVVIRSPQALRRLVTAPNELGLGRAYVSGELDLDGDIFAVLALQDRLLDLRVSPAQVLEALRILGLRSLKPLAPPPEEARLHGVRHSKERDAAAIAHHYDVSNDFYRTVLGPSMTYSCAVWTDTTTSLEEAQANKYELVATKLGLEPGMRLLDIGCGWGGMIMHAAEHHGVNAVGVTLSRRQAEYAAKRVADAGLTGRVEVRCVDYRDVDDGPYDAISSIGMFEHVGWTQLGQYFDRCAALLAPGGRFLNHGISEPPYVFSNPAARAVSELRARFGRGLGHDFFNRYVFPDGELHEVGLVVSAIQRAGLEARHVESLREHYALTLRQWVQNLEHNWDQAVREAGEARARVWRLYIAASAIGFEANQIEIHQVLATKSTDGRSGMPLRPRFT
ncbi:MAG TPA: cyclopropane-fatty-acyl-phospholipid synthase family protein [Acidimicrobiia bacterium]|jgi:cyclopropane-fatty-acyl-phospholipid synthase